MKLSLTSIRLMVVLNVSLRILTANILMLLNDRSRYFRVGDIITAAQIGSNASFPKVLCDRFSDFKVTESLITGTR